MYLFIRELSKIGDFIKELQVSNILEVDTETTGLDCFNDKIILLQVRTKNQIFIFDYERLGNKNFTYVVDRFFTNVSNSSGSATGKTQVSRIKRTEGTGYAGKVAVIEKSWWQFLHSSSNRILMI